MLLAAMLLLAIFGIFGHSNFVRTLYCGLGTMLFGVYLVIDTQMILGGRRMQLTIDDSVQGAMLLYIDIVQIFLYMLEMMGRNNRG